MAFGVYLHFPYCLSKCPYCDFASVAGAPPHERYAKAVAREAALRAQEAAGRVAGSLYLGGGTPSLWEPGAARLAVGAIRELFRFEPGAELTLEANPGAADLSRLAAFEDLGFDRLSLGVQSFDDATLSQLGRAHSGAQAVEAIALAREAGFANLGLDLIHGAPQQTAAMARRDAECAARFLPEHLSCYALTLEHNAIEVPMARSVREGRRAVPDADLQWEMGRAVGEALAAAGYRRYEISNWCRPGRASRHNALYWTGGEYLGLGAGASGFLLADPADPSRGGRRYSNHRDPERWLADLEAGRPGEAGSEDLDAATLLRERRAIGLRQVDGVDALAACAQLGLEAAPVLAAARGLEAGGLATLRGGVVALTERGLDVHSEAVLAFL